MVSQSTSRQLFARTTCLYGLRTYLQGLFARTAVCFSTYLKVIPGDCWPRQQPISTVSNPTYREMSVQGAACLYGFKSYLRGTVGWGCSQLIRFLNLFRNVSYNKSCLDFAIYNTPKQCFGPFVSDIVDWYNYPLFAHVGGGKGEGGEDNVLHV